MREVTTGATDPIKPGVVEGSPWRDGLSPTHVNLVEERVAIPLVCDGCRDIGSTEICAGEIEPEQVGEKRVDVPQVSTTQILTLFDGPVELSLGLERW